MMKGGAACVVAAPFSLALANVGEAFPEFMQGLKRHLRTWLSLERENARERSVSVYGSSRNFMTMARQYRMTDTGLRAPGMGLNLEPAR
jgi:hypothetical protein